MKETINEIRSYLVYNYNHVSSNQLSDEFILEFMSREYLMGLSFDGKMDCLYDYILSQGLCDVVE
jgi:hypothetical protein